MKKAKRLILLTCLMAILSVCLTACIRIDIAMTIKRNGKLDISMLYAAQESMLAMLEAGDDFLYSQEDLEEFVRNGWTVEDYSAGGYKGYTISIKDVSSSRLQGDDGDADLDMEGLDNLKIRMEGGRVILDMAFDSEETSEFNEYLPMIRQAGGSFTFTITLPKKPINSNATIVSEDGKTLTWDFLTANLAQGIHLEYRLFNPILIIAAAVGLIVLIVLIVMLLLQRRKKMGELPPREKEIW